jgi:hypothetical protein
MEDGCMACHAIYEIMQKNSLDRFLLLHPRNDGLKLKNHYIICCCYMAQRSTVSVKLRKSRKRNNNNNLQTRNLPCAPKQ